MEDYAIHIAPKGGKIDQIIQQVHAEREAARKKRMAYAESKGGIGTYGNEMRVTGVIFEHNPPPIGWRMDHTTSGGIVALPSKKTPEGKKFALELASLPDMPGVDTFSGRIGCPFVIIDRHLRRAWFSERNSKMFVMTPWTYKSDDDANSPNEIELTIRNRTAFLPEGCERVPISTYYLAVEADEAKELLKC